MTSEQNIFVNEIYWVFCITVLSILYQKIVVPFFKFCLCKGVKHKTV